MDITTILGIAALFLCIYFFSRSSSTSSSNSSSSSSSSTGTFPEQIKLIYKAGEYMMNLNLGESRDILAVADTGSHELTISNNKCTNCPREYGVYKENIDTPINEKIKYVSQTTEYSVLHESLTMGNYNLKNYEFGSVDSIVTNGQYSKYNVFGLSPLSDIWEHISSPKIMSFNFKDNYLQFNKQINTNKGIPMIESTSSMPYYMVMAKLNGSPIRVIIDTGFTKTVIPPSFTNQTNFHLEFENGTTIEMNNDSTSCTFDNFNGCLLLGNKWLINKSFDFDVEKRLFFIN